MSVCPSIVVVRCFIHFQVVDLLPFQTDTVHLRCSHCRHCVVVAVFVYVAIIAPVAADMRVAPVVVLVGVVAAAFVFIVFEIISAVVKFVFAGAVL